MPTYDYVCTNCSHSFEFFQSMKDEPLKECPNCKGELKRKIGTGAGAIFKGTGFYQTDYKNSINQNKSKPPKADKKPDTSKGE